MGNLKKMGNKIVPFQLQRISQTLTTLEGGGELSNVSL